jgi:hypothetical protein
MNREAFPTQSKAADERVLALREKPMKADDIARATRGKLSTTLERPRRLQGSALPSRRTAGARPKRELLAPGPLTKFEPLRLVSAPLAIAEDTVLLSLASARRQPRDGRDSL